MVLNAAPSPPQAKQPSTAVNRQLQSRNYTKPSKTVLKAAIGSLQDLNYTIDVLNSDIGVITASRTTEEKKADVSSDKNTTDVNIDSLETKKINWAKGCANVLVIGLVIGLVFVGLQKIFGGGSDDEDDSNNRPSKNSSNRDSGSLFSFGDGGGETNNYYTVDDSPKGPVIYRYKVTINLEELDSENTRIRVSASGESEQDGSILKTGGIHEADFFRKFFASMEKSMFLDENLAQ